VYVAHLTYHCITALHTVLSQERHQSASCAQVKLCTALVPTTTTATATAVSAAATSAPAHHA
jgi:hypothetical protein